MFESMGKFIILVGLVLVVVGFLVMAIGKLNLPHNPLDFHIRWKGVDIYFPLGSSILISLALTVLLNLILWVFVWLMKR